MLTFPMHRHWTAVVVLLTAAASLVVVAGLFTEAIGPSQFATSLAQQQLEQHLGWARGQGMAAEQAALEALDRFFANAQAGTPAFAVAALDWGSKLRLVGDYLPGSDGQGHATYLAQLFAQHIFSPEQVEQVVQQLLRDYAAELTAIDSQLLARLQEGFNSASVASSPPMLDPKVFHTTCQTALDEVQHRVAGELGHDVLYLATSTIVGQWASDGILLILERIGVPLGVSGGVLATSTAWSWETFGMGLVAGLAVDAAISYLWDWLADPRGAVAAIVERRLEELKRLLLDGPSGQDGLRQLLHSLGESRNAARQAAILITPSQ